MRFLKKDKKSDNEDIFLSEGIRLHDEPIQVTPSYLLKEIFGLNNKLPSPEELFKDNPWYSNSPDTLVTRYFEIKKRTEKLFKEIITKYDLNPDTDIINLTDIKWTISFNTKSDIKYIYIESIENENKENSKKIYSNKVVDTTIIEEKDITLIKFENDFQDFNTGICKKIHCCMVLLNKNEDKTNNLYIKKG